MRPINTMDTLASVLASSRGRTAGYETRTYQSDHEDVALDDGERQSGEEDGRSTGEEVKGQFGTFGVVFSEEGMESESEVAQEDEDEAHWRSKRGEGRSSANYVVWKKAEPE
jgi:hypothetical protein